MSGHTRWRMSAINWLTALCGGLLALCGGARRCWHSLINRAFTLRLTLATAWLCRRVLPPNSVILRRGKPNLLWQTGPRAKVRAASNRGRRPTAYGLLRSRERALFRRGDGACAECVAWSLRCQDLKGQHGCAALFSRGFPSTSDMSLHCGPKYSGRKHCVLINLVGKFGAVEKTRTSTPVKEQRPQRCASTNSATTASGQWAGLSRAKSD